MDPLDIDLVNVPTHDSSRRRSSLIARQILEAISENDDESFDDELHFDFVALGGGIAAGYWAQKMSDFLARRGQTAAIVSGDPIGLVPFDRPALSKNFLDPGAEDLRDFSGAASSFPFIRQESTGELQYPDWYQRMGITVLSECQAVSADLDQKYLKVKRISSGEDEQPLFGETIKVGYRRLLIATGVRPRRIGDETKSSNPIRAVQRSCFCSRHLDIRAPALKCIRPDQFGFGSVHHLRDIGDVLKLTHAMTRVEDDGQDTCDDPAVVIGGGFIACEAAAAMITHCPGLPIAIVLPGDEVMGSTGFGKDICHFYEKRFARAGVALAKGYRVTRLWSVDEQGSFPTLERSSQGSVMKKTPPRSFGRVDAHFTDCRGAVLANKQGDEVWLPARFLVVGIGSVPNSELFLDSLELSSDGGIITDSLLRTSHPSGDVFAAGDVACAPVPLAAASAAADVVDAVLDESPAAAAGRTRHEHAKTARDMGVHAANAMLGIIDEDSPYDPVPCMYSSFLDVSWKFYGFTQGESCVLGLETFSSTRTFGGFWISNGRIVGAFLEEDPSSGNDHSMTLEYMARARPRVLSIKCLRKCPLDRLLDDPHCLEPPTLGVGEFHADTDEASIEEVFRKHSGATTQVKKTDMGAVMQELGADWDADELTDALLALDPSDSGFVDLNTFCTWWLG